MARDDATDVEKHFRDAISAVVTRRAEAVRSEREATRDIAALCVDAKAAGVRMADLAAWVKVLNKQDELHSVTRQAIDQLVASHQGRPRAPRRRPQREEAPSKIKVGAFA